MQAFLGDKINGMAFSISINKIGAEYQRDYITWIAKIESPCLGKIDIEEGYPIERINKQHRFCEALMRRYSNSGLFILGEYVD